MQQVNFKTKKVYTGANHITLLSVGSQKGFKSNKWMTFVQAKEMGYKVSKGEKGIKIVRFLEKKEENKKGKLEKKTGVRYFTVFNIEQCERA